MFFFFKQKTAYEMRISDWSSDVCSSDLCQERPLPGAATPEATARSRAISDDDPEISGAEAITVPGVQRRRGGRPAPRGLPCRFKLTVFIYRFQGISDPGSSVGTVPGEIS